ncbi:hypothetical protein GDO78_014042 [Eleutherodactylus coqui]|uniref:Uncharacterized protein n=1 Tax=Eleutherodactylus coqui TaxID=57060 RepID=A0A8J6EEZ7_ELECQ|nr:hypothetical protein GDO78_014042 [Eleutherodactylus coqui]
MRNHQGCCIQVGKKYTVNLDIVPLPRHFTVPPTGECDEYKYHPLKTSTCYVRRKSIPSWGSIGGSSRWGLYNHMLVDGIKEVVWN